jgi:hypothetical protein
MQDDDDRAVLEETLDALEMPLKGVRRWMRADRKFCDAHGGRRVYGELLALFDEVDAAVARRDPKR